MNEDSQSPIQSTQDLPAIRRLLKIKAGVTKRLDKEYNLYIKEAEAQKIKLDRFIADKAEDWDIKNATRMMEESNKMITDSSTRLGKAAEELRSLVLEAKKIPELAEDDNLSNADAVLEGITA